MAVTGKWKVTTGIKDDCYEYHWKIENWVRVQETKDSVNDQKFVIEASRSPHIQSKWEVGFAVYEHPRLGNIIKNYLKLLKIHGPANELRSTINFELARNDDRVSNFTMGKTFHVNEALTTTSDGNFFFVFNEPYKRHVNYLDSEGAVNMFVKLTVLTPLQLTTQAEILVSNVFVKQFMTVSQNNYASFLQDSSSADLKIVTSDGKELGAHKLILKVQSPFFASMFRSQFSENSTGVVNVEDISGKTMGILLKYWYTGQLLPTWSDEDTVHEFTYAAGKYQMTDVLEMLDSVLGPMDGKEPLSSDLQLFNLAHKLSLKNAAKRLMERIKKNIMNVDCPDEFLDLFARARIEDYPDNNSMLVKANQK